MHGFQMCHTKRMMHMLQIVFRAPVMHKWNYAHLQLHHNTLSYHLFYLAIILCLLCFALCDCERLMHAPICCVPFTRAAHSSMVTCIYAHIDTRFFCIELTHFFSFLTTGSFSWQALTQQNALTISRACNSYIHICLWYVYVYSKNAALFLFHHSLPISSVSKHTRKKKWKWK